MRDIGVQVTVCSNPESRDQFCTLFGHSVSNEINWLFKATTPLRKVCHFFDLYPQYTTYTWNKRSKVMSTNYTWWKRYARCLEIIFLVRPMSTKSVQNSWPEAATNRSSFLFFSSTRPARRDTTLGHRKSFFNRSLRAYVTSSFSMFSPPLYWYCSFFFYNKKPTLSIVGPEDRNSYRW